jgi:ABC-type glycerol-3-phosphate transport system substrate-binding protein
VVRRIPSREELVLISARGSGFMQLGILVVRRFAFATVSGFVLVAALHTVGCFNRETSNPSTDRPLSGMSLRIGVPGDVGLESQWDAVIEEWSVQTGAKVERVSIPSPFRPDAITGKLQAVVLPTPLMSEFFASHPLGGISPQWFADANLGDGFNGLMDRICQRGRSTVLIPLNAPVLVLYYREDLLDAAKLSPPETWTDYQKLLETLGEWAPGLTAVEPWGEEFRATMFFARSAAYASHPNHYSVFFDIDTVEPAIDTPGFQRGLEEARVALTRLSTDSLTMTPLDCRREFFAGRAALAIGFETGGETLPTLMRPLALCETQPEDRAAAKPTTEVASEAKSTEESRPAALHAGVSRLPGSFESYNRTRKAWEKTPDQRPRFVALTGFAGLSAAVARSLPAQEQDAALNLIKTLLQPEVVGSAMPGVYGPCYESQLDQPAAWGGSELTAAEFNRYLNAVATSLRDTTVISELSIIGRNRYRGAVTARLGDWLRNQGSDPAATLAAIKSDWSAITAEIGVDRVRDSHRAGIGLAAALRQTSGPEKPTPGIPSKPATSEEDD